MPSGCWQHGDWLLTRHHHGLVRAAGLEAPGHPPDLLLPPGLVLGPAAVLGGGWVAVECRGGGGGWSDQGPVCRGWRLRLRAVAGLLGRINTRLGAAEAEAGMREPSGGGTTDTQPRDGAAVVTADTHTVHYIG